MTVTQWVETLDCGRLEITAGTPTRRATSGTVVWALNDSGTNGVGSQIAVPLQITKVHIDLWWIQQTTGEGNVRLSINLETCVAGHTLGAPSSDSLTVAAPGTADVLAVTRMKAEVPVTPQSLLLVRVSRAGAHASDTLVGDMRIQTVVVSEPPAVPGSLVVPAEYIELN